MTKWKKSYNMKLTKMTCEEKTLHVEMLKKYSANRKYKRKEEKIKMNKCEKPWESNTHTHTHTHTI